MGFRPDGDVRCQYQFSFTGAGEKVTGVRCDLDGDAVRVRITAQMDAGSDAFYVSFANGGGSECLPYSLHSCMLLGYY